jgi:5-methylcytosine-specific restriction endonuclease McrA
MEPHQRKTIAVRVAAERDATVTGRLTLLSNGELTARLKLLVAHSRRVDAAFLVHLMEFDTRRLYADEGFPSLFACCIKELGCTEATAYRRIYAARLARRFPIVLALLEEGAIHIEATALLGPCLNAGNHAALLHEARGKSRRQIEKMVAVIAPRPDRRDHIQAMPSPARQPPSENSESPPPTSPKDPTVPHERPPAIPAAPAMILEREDVEALSPNRYHFGFSGSEELLRRIERIKDLLRHKFPTGRLEDVIFEVAESFLNQRDPERNLARRRAKPRDSTKTIKRRRVPNWVRAAVWKRDGGQCVFQTPSGRRCAATLNLEFDHILPWACEGPSDDPANIRLLCRAHNQLTARQKFGPRNEA